MQILFQGDWNDNENDGRMHVQKGGKKEEKRSEEGRQLLTPPLVASPLARMLPARFPHACFPAQGKEACQGSECQYAYGASFYHFSCKDCKCV